MKILIEGPSGAGKSTLIKHIKGYIKERNCVFNNIYDSGEDIFKKDSHINAEYDSFWTDFSPEACFEMQKRFLLTLGALEEKIDSCPGDISIMSRSIHSAHNIYNSIYYNLKYLDDVKLQLFDKIYDDLAIGLKPYDMIVLLDCEKDSIMKRGPRYLVTKDTKPKAFEIHVKAFDYYTEKCRKIYRNLSMLTTSIDTNINARYSMVLCKQSSEYRGIVEKIGDAIIERYKTHKKIIPEPLTNDYSYNPIKDTTEYRAILEEVDALYNKKTNLDQHANYNAAAVGEYVLME